MKEENDIYRNLFIDWGIDSWSVANDYITFMYRNQECTIHRDEVKPTIKETFEAANKICHCGKTFDSGEEACRKCREFI